MFCKKCGTSIKDGVLFCTVCGSRVDVAQKSISDTEKFEKAALPFKKRVLAFAALCRELSANCENTDTASRKKQIYTRLSEDFEAMAFCVDKIRMLITEFKGFAETPPSEDDVHLIETECSRIIYKLKKHSDDIKELIVLCSIEAVELPCKKDAKSAIAEVDDLCHKAATFTQIALRGIERNRIGIATDSRPALSALKGVSQPQYSCTAPEYTVYGAATKSGVKGALKRDIREFFSKFRKRGKDNKTQTSVPHDIMFEENKSVSFNAAVPTQQTKDPDMDSFALTEVQFSAIVQKEVSREEYVSLDIIMYEDDFRKIVEEKLDETVKEVKKHYYGIANQSRIKVVLTAKGAEIDDSVEEYVWQGKYLEFSFLAYVPGEYTGKQISFCATVYANDIIATRLNIIVSVNGGSANTTEFRRDDINTAFISYSSDDRIRVSSIIQGMKKMRPDLDVFMDVESLRSGEDWQSKLQNEIDKRDVLFLCWSKSAKASKWVEFEWRYALERKGEEYIEPLPIDPTELCEPPEELSKKHFNDKMVYLVKALEYMSNKTPYITVCEGGISKKICINKDEFILGRDKQGTDYSITSPKISKFHARIIKDKGQYFVIDLGSVNKTYVDGEECAPGARTPIGNGSLLKLADEEILFELV